MAVVDQVEHVIGTLVPFETINMEPERNYTSEPYAICVVQESILVVDSDAGTATFKMFMHLPFGSCYILKSFSATLTEAETAAATLWRGQSLRLPWSKDNRDAHAGIFTEILCPLQAGKQPQLGLTTADVAIFRGFGIGTRIINPDAGGYMTQPDYIMYGLEGITTTQVPSFEMDQPSQQSDDQTLAIVVEWWAFNVEQSNHSALRWNFPVRSS